MSRQGDIENPLSFESDAPTLSTGSIAATPANGDITFDGRSPTDSDQYLGTFTWTLGSPTLGLGSVPAPQAHGDVTELYGINDSQAETASVFTSTAPTLGLGSVAAVTGQGDIISPLAFNTVGSTIGAPSSQDNGQGDIPSPNSFVTLNPTLGTGTPTLRGPRGDLGELYSRVEGPIGQLVWQTGSPTLTTGSVSVPPGQGDIVGDQPSAGYGTVATTLVRNPEPPVLSFTVANAVISLTWTPWPPTAPDVPNIQYNLYRGVNGATPTLYQANVAQPFYNDSALTRGNTYTYFVVPVVPRTNVGTFPSNSVMVQPSVTNFYNSPGSYTYTKPTGQYAAYQLDLTTIAGGGGGGGGHGGQQGFMCGGQGGGAGGIVISLNINASLIATTVAVLVGSGGAGVANGTAPSGTSSNFGSYALTNGGSGGFTSPESSALAPGGTASSTLSGATVATGGQGGQGNSAYTSPPNWPDAPATSIAPSGGGGGAAQDGGGNVTPGGAGGAITVESVPATTGGISYYTSSNVTAGNGHNGVTAANLAGSGGGGGGAALAFGAFQIMVGGRGGDGGGYGAGGGGGGSALGGFGGSGTQGAGGNGANGCVNVITWFW